MCTNYAGALEKPPLPKKLKLCDEIVTSTNPPLPQNNVFVRTQIYNSLYQRVFPTKAMIITSKFRARKAQERHGLSKSWQRNLRILGM